MWTTYQVAAEKSLWHWLKNILKNDVLCYAIYDLLADKTYTCLFQYVIKNTNIADNLPNNKNLSGIQEVWFYVSDEWWVHDK